MIKRKALLKILLAFLLLFVFEFTVRRDVITLDGIRGEILGCISITDTRYAPHYSHEKFARIKIGMTEEELIKILGEPLLRWKPYSYSAFKHKSHYIGFQYSESPSSTHYRLRQIYLDSGKVAEIISYFYID